jgi:hypothetical protein
VSDASDRYCAVIEANHLALYRYWCERILGSYLCEDDASFVVITGVPHAAVYNVLLLTLRDEPLAPEAIRERIAATLQPFKVLRVPLVWYVWPSSRPADLARHLEAVGPARVVNSPAMALDRTAWPGNVPHPPSLRMEQVRDASTLERWIDLPFTGFGFCRQADEEPVAMTALFLCGHAAARPP